MRILLACLGISLSTPFLAGPAGAQGLPGLEVSVTPLQAPPGKQVVVTLVNNSSQPVNVHCGGLLGEVFAGSTCAGTPVLQSFWACTAFHSLAPGESESDLWDQLDQQGQPVAPGAYSLEVFYWDAQGTYTACAPVTLTAGPQTTPYCTAGTSASGCRATLSTSGVASASSGSGFILNAASVEGGANGLFYFGTAGRQALPWGNGTSFQCVVPPLRRAEPMLGQGTTGACDGSFARDLNALWCPTCPKSQVNPGAGATAQAQLWYRDTQSTSNQPTSLSDAVEFCVQL